MMDCLTHRPDVNIFPEMLEFMNMNGCISFNIGPINTKLQNVANFKVLFLTIWVSCCLSHNKPTRTQPLLI